MGLYVQSPGATWGPGRSLGVTYRPSGKHAGAGLIILLIPIVALVRWLAG